MEGYIYLLRRPMWADNVFKIGRATDISRLGSYGAKAKIYRFAFVSDQHLFEKVLISEFNRFFKLVEGRENFMGDIVLMLEIFDSVLRNCNDLSNSDKQGNLTIESVKVDPIINDDSPFNIEKAFDELESDLLADVRLAKKLDVWTWIFMKSQQLIKDGWNEVDINECLMDFQQIKRLVTLLDCFELGNK